MNVPAETLKERIRNDLAAARLALEVLADPAISPDTRATHVQMGRRRLDDAQEAIVRLAALPRRRGLGRRVTG